MLTRPALTIDRRPRRRIRLVPLTLAAVTASVLTACDLVGDLLGDDGEDATAEEATEEPESAGADDAVADDGSADGGGAADDDADDDAEDDADGDGSDGTEREDADGDDAEDGAAQGTGEGERTELVEALPGTLDEVLVADGVNLNTYLGGVEWSGGDRLTVVCQEPVEDRLRNMGVWGTDVYALSNYPCLAGAHAGAIDIEEGGTAAIELLERFDHPDIEVEDRDGVEAQRWGRSGPGFRFLDPEELEAG